MTNPTPWPSFENLSVSFATLHLNRVYHTELIATFLQRWWRERKGRPTEPRGDLLLNGRALDVGRLAGRLRLEPRLLDTEVFAFEKLDGTNFGIRCDGARFGRRSRLQGDTYQKVPVSVAPDQCAVNRVKEALATHCGLETSTLPSFMLYGELMCNAGKFRYTERGHAKTYRCFGAAFERPNSVVGEEGLEASRQLSEALRKGGLNTLLDTEGGKVTVVCNDVFADLVTALGITVAPFILRGRLEQIVTDLQERMLRNDMEGVVLTGQGFIKKWKTGEEDESKGADELSRLLALPPSHFGGRDRVVAELLRAVAANKKVSAKGGAAKEPKAVVPPPFDADVMSRALRSAESKYDALDAYFERDAQREIKSLLLREVLTDLEVTPDQEAKWKFVDQSVSRWVGVAYGAWKRRDTRP